MAKEYYREHDQGGGGRERPPPPPQKKRFGEDDTWVVKFEAHQGKENKGGTGYKGGDTEPRKNRGRESTEVMMIQSSKGV